MPGEDRIDDSRGAVDDVERRRETQLRLAGGMRAGSSSVTQPVSTAFMWMPSFTKSGALVRVIMLSAAFAMFVCGCLSVLVVR